MDQTTHTAYDTRAAVRELTDAGMPEPQAEAVARAQARVFELKHAIGAQTAFDTRTVVRELADAGMPEPQAVAVADGLARVVEHNRAVRAAIEEAGREAGSGKS